MPKEVVSPQVVANWFANKRKELRRKSNEEAQQNREGAQQGAQLHQHQIGVINPLGALPNAANMPTSRGGSAPRLNTPVSRQCSAESFRIISEICSELLGFGLNTFAASR